MKNKLLKSAGITFLLLAFLAGNVFAFSLGTTDGVWGRIDSTTGFSTGADCERYGAVEAPTYTLFDAVGIIYNVNVGPGGETERYVRSPSVCSGDIDGDIRFKDNISFDGWTRTTTGLWGGLGSHTITCTSPSGLFISEYVYEQFGGANNDRLAIEIYNGTGGSVNLGAGDYSLLLFRDDRTFDKIDLSGTVSAGDVHVIVNNAAAGSTTAEDQTFANNDNYRTVVLVKDYVNATTTQYGNQGQRATIYNITTDDENQVRYGTPSGYTTCPNSDGSQKDRFELQSGFGFEGQIDSNFEPEVDELFPIGRFCHYNNPISTPSDYLNTVPLELTINSLGCPTGQSIDPAPPNNNLTFDFLFTLDETPNAANPCAYGPSAPGWPGGSANPNVSGDYGPNRSGCADMVRITAPDADQSFTCVIDPVNELEQEYFVSIMGFTPITAGGICPDVPTGTIQFNQIYTAEQVRNCYCVYASYTRSQITPVTLASLSAEGVENGILISWETVTETNNFGFNILRAESTDGERLQINPEIIFSSLAPGDPFGSSYEYLDETALPGVEYIYWLVDIPLDGTETGLHGPISAVWGLIAE
jgi:hypothetical protein